jgi:hypothetical protein
MSGEIIGASSHHGWLRAAPGRSATSFIPKLKNAHPSGNRESYTFASNTARPTLFMAVRPFNTFTKS